MSDENTASELGEGLRDLRSDAGLPPPTGKEAAALELDTRWTVQRLAMRVADMLKHSDGRHGLYRMDDVIVTIDPVSGATKRMTPKRFRTYLPNDLAICIHKGKSKHIDEKTQEESYILKEDSLTNDQAEVMLETGAPLWLKLPVLKAVHPVALPVFDDELDERGLRKLRLLEPGYDAKTGIFTLAKGLDYDRSMEVQDAAEWMFNTFMYFGWRNFNRDFAIHLANALTMFCRGLYVGRAPMFVYNANQPNSGKTRLATWCSWLVYGSKGTKSLQKDSEDKLDQNLNTAARSNSPFVIFDNVDWGNHEVRSALLDEGITQSERSFRQMNSQVDMMVPVMSTWMMTGNNLKLSTDLQRRSLIVDLLNRVAGSDRVLPKNAILIDDEYFASAEIRKAGLAAMWAFVRAWDEAGRPGHPVKPLDSFESWGRTIPGMVMHAGKKGFIKDLDCMAVSSNAEIGDVVGRNWKLLGELAVAEFGLDPAEGVMRERFEITVAQFAGVARRTGKSTEKLWPECDVQSVLDTEDAKGGWKYKEVKGTDDGMEFGVESDEEIAARKDGDRRRQASEWLNAKTRSSFGKALMQKINERDHRGPDGNMYRTTFRTAVEPAQYMVTRV